jgi:hypothetical protein
VRENPTMWVVITEFEEHFQDQVKSSADTHRNLILSSFNAARKPMEREIFSDLLFLKKNKHQIKTVKKLPPKELDWLAKMGHQAETIDNHTYTGKEGNPARDIP